MDFGSQGRSSKPRAHVLLVLGQEFNPRHHMVYWAPTTRNWSLVHCLEQAFNHQACMARLSITRNYFWAPWELFRSSLKSKIKQGPNSVSDPLPRMCQALSSIYSTAKKIKISIVWGQKERVHWVRQLSCTWMTLVWFLVLYMAHKTHLGVIPMFQARSKPWVLLGIAQTPSQPQLLFSGKKDKYRK